jgi:hypothetical protein
MKKRLRPVFALLSVTSLIGAVFVTMPAAQASSSSVNRSLCDDNAVTCTEADNPYNYEGNYVGHDEPSALFYSNTPGTGNSQVYQMRLPKDPPNLPNQAGTGGTFNFQLHPAFWFGMAMCDDQSAPNPGGSTLAGQQIGCTPDSDSNIYDGSTLADPKYIGKHPGVAYMEMQFYPPGWVLWPPGNSCDATKWCAALNIDSYISNQNSGASLNGQCQSAVGIEPVNFAFITKSGKAQAPANPVDATAATYTPDPGKDLFMNSGDLLRVALHDTAAGFRVDINDLSSEKSGSMTASTANGFGHVIFAPPPATSCTTDHQAFHPAYSTSSEHTRVPWAAHSYNVAFSDEIGHFEYCAVADPNTGGCTTAGVNDPAGTDADDAGCFNANQSSRIQVAGCLGTEVDFDGVPYQNTWPGTNPNPVLDRAFHSTPILFTSPRSNGHSYERVAFETDLPRVEVFGPPNACNRSTGAGCVNPPKGASFYPFFSTRNGDNRCFWQLGGDYIPGTTNDFGGSSTTAFGPLLFLTYPTSIGPITRTNDFRNVLRSNPCGQSQGEGGD